MPIKPVKSKAVKLPPGDYGATADKLTDLGNQVSPFNPDKPKPTVLIEWKTEVGGHVINQWVTNSLCTNPISNLVKIVQAIHGEDFDLNTYDDLEELIGHKVTLRLEPSSKGFSRVMSVSPYKSKPNGKPTSKPTSKNLHDLDVSDDDLPNLDDTTDVQ